MNRSFMIRHLFIAILLLNSGINYASEKLSQRITDQLTDQELPSIPLIEALGEKAYWEAINSVEYRYVGNSKCRLCHRDFFLGRKGDKHDHTFKRLVDLELQQSPKCLACHSTGYGVKGGFVSIAETPRLSNVQCEGCHGPGSVHMIRNSAGGFLAGSDRPEILKKMCKSCHNQRWSHSYQNFEKAYDGYRTAEPSYESSEKNLK